MLILVAVSLNLMTFAWCCNIPLKLLLQELMVETGFYQFNGVLTAN